jgi:S-formylglutathione hydrolase FrmB
VLGDGRVRRVIAAAGLLAATIGGGPAWAQAPAGRIIADTVRSLSLGVAKQFVVYLPPSYGRVVSRRYPVAYYLHGAWGSEWDWSRQGRIGAVLDSLAAANGTELIVVMPDGDDGWYTTWNLLGNNAACQQKPLRQDESPASYCVPWPKYDEYVARDLVAKVDSSYRTIANRAHRAIAGLSMGGYGAITLALRYPSVFSAAASHSGVLSPLYVGPHPFAAPPQYATRMDQLAPIYRGLWPIIAPAFGNDTAAWWSRMPGRIAQRLVASRRGPMPAIMLDVGSEDNLVDQNRDFHATLQRLGVAHVYTEWPGVHDWMYWRAHVGESLTWIAGKVGAVPGPARRRTGTGTGAGARLSGAGAAR